MNKHFRPQIQNGPIAKRTQVAYSVRPAPQASTRAASAVLTQLSPAWSAPTVEVGALKQRGLSLLGLDEQLRSTTKTAATAARRPYALVGLLFCGALLAGAFMFSLRDHFIAHAFGRNDLHLKSQTEELKARNQRLKADVEHAASPQEIDREARKSSGLAPLEFDQKKITSGAKQITAAEKAKTAPQPKTKSARQ